VLTVIAFLNVPASIGYPVLFGLVAAESAGALVPGETAVIVAGALAARGQLSLPLVIAIAAAAAIFGDNLGYLIGRNGLRRLLDRPSRFAARRQRAVRRGEAFFKRHGPAAVFFGRWLPGLRVVVAWLAGAERLSWRRFLLWNSLGGVAWAASIASVAYALGRSASGYVGLIGLFGRLATPTPAVIASVAVIGCTRRFVQPSCSGRSCCRRRRRRAKRLALARESPLPLLGSACPHYDSEDHRRPAYTWLVAEGFPPGLAADDCLALSFEGREQPRS